MTAPNTMAKRAAAGTLALAVCFTGGVLGASVAQAAPGFKFDQRLGGTDRFETAAKASQEAFDSAGDVIVVQDDALADGLTASYLAGVKKGPILYVKKDSVPSATSTEINRLKAERIWIVGGTGVVSDSVKNSLGSNNRDVKRVSGKDRFETAARVATSDSNDVGTVFIANGDAPADALAAGPIAYASTNPILLTRSMEVPASTKAALDQLNEENRIVLGGNAVVSTSTYADLGANERLAGLDRQGTAVKIADYATANEGFSKANVALVGSEDRNTADALIAAPLLGQTKTPILFTTRGGLGTTSKTYLENNANSLTGTGYVFGGNAAVSQSVADEATSAASGSGPVTPPNSNSQVTVSSTTIEGQDVGTGTAQSPAVSYGKEITASATLTGSGGQAIGGLDAFLIITGPAQPTVTLPSGAVVPAVGTAGSPNVSSYRVATDASGKASVTIAVPAGTESSLDIKFQAPASDANNEPVENDSSFIQFVTENSLGLSPFGINTADGRYKVVRSSTNEPGVGNTVVTATLPPLNGAPQKNAEVTFEIQAGTNAFFASASGAASTTSKTTTAFTDDNGQAFVYVNDLDAENVSVTATTANGNTSKVTYLQFGQAGIATQVDALRATGIQSGSGTVGAPYVVNTDTNTTISGTVQDTNDNAVPGATLLVVSNQGRGQFATGAGADAKNSNFPNATPVTGATVSSTGAPFGTLVTADGSGRFSVTVSDTKEEAATYSIFAVANGLVQGGSIGNVSVNYAPNKRTVTGLGVSTGNRLSAAYADNDDAAPATLTGVSFPVSTLQTGGTAGQFNAPPQQIEFGAFNGADNDFLFDNPESALTYQVSADGGGSGIIGSINGVLLDGSGPAGLPNKPTSATVRLVNTANGGSATDRTITVNVNGVAIGSYTLVKTGNAVTATPGTAVVGIAGFSLPTDVNADQTAAPYASSFINVGVANTKAESTTFTATVNGKSATATVAFSSSAVTKLTATPTVSSPSDGSEQTVTYTARDTNDNAKANAPVTLAGLDTGDLDGLFITKVNGTTLTQPIGANGAQRQTPIPLGSDTTAYTSVVVPDAVSWTNGNNATFTTDADGKFSITVKNRNVALADANTNAGVTTTNSAFNGSFFVGSNGGVFTADNVQPASPSTTVSTVTYSTTGVPAAVNATPPAVQSIVATSPTTIAVTYDKAVNYGAGAAAQFTYDVDGAGGAAAVAATGIAGDGSDTITLTVPTFDPAEGNDTLNYTAAGAAKVTAPGSNGGNAADAANFANTIVTN